MTGQWLIAAVLLLLGLAALGGVLSLSGHAGWILGGLLLAALVAATTDVASDGFTVGRIGRMAMGTHGRQPGGIAAEHTDAALA